MALNAKQKLFVAEYLVDKNATRAAIKAGYSKSTAQTQGPRLLQNVEIKEAVDKVLNKQVNKLELSAERILLEMKRVAFADIGDIFDKDGKLLNIKEMSEDARRTVSAVETDEIFVGRGSSRAKLGVTRKIKMHDKMKALEQLGRHLNLFAKDEEKPPEDNGVRVILTLPANGSEAPPEGVV